MPPNLRLHCSTSGKYCLTGGFDRSVKLWNPYRSEPGEEDVEGGSPLLIQTFKGPHGHPVHDLCVYVWPSRGPDDLRAWAAGALRDRVAADGCVYVCVSVCVHV